MNSYVFMTDSDSDLPFFYVDESDITMVYMPYSINGKDCIDDLGRNGTQKSFFDEMRNGSVPVTSQLPMGAYMEYLEPAFKEGKDVLFLSFSGQLSATLNNLRAAYDELLEQYPERKLRIVDTLSISAPQGILILKAYKLYKDGKSLEEVAQWVEDNKLRAQAFFTVDDLVYLKRGGRISATAAAFGSLLELKPIITETREGKLQSVDKIKGRKKALRTLVEKAAAQIDNPQECHPIVMHADDIESANLLAELWKKEVPDLPKVDIWPVGPVIGAHCGPGTVAVVFFGKERTL